MPRPLRAFLGALALVLVAAGGPLVASSSAQVTVIPRIEGKIMVQGDSISAGYLRPSYRKPLLDLLSAQECNVDMVGDQKLNSFDFRDPDNRPGSHFAGFAPSDGYDVDHQAFGGITADQYADGVPRARYPVRPVADSVRAFQPDYVLLHLGTNDMNGAIRAGMSTIDEIRAWADETVGDVNRVIDSTIAAHDNPSEIRILVANFIPYRYPGDLVEQGTSSIASTVYRQRLEAMVENRADERVVLVDVARDFNPFMMTFDGIHPNERGERHIAEAFVEVLTAEGLCVDTPVIAPPAIVDPVPGTVLGTGSQRFTWAANGTDVGQWWVWAGTAPFGRDVFNSGRITDVDARTVTMTGLPTNGETIHVTLWYRSPQGTWANQRFTYTAPRVVLGPVEPAIVDPAPVPGAMTSGPTQTFTWTPNGTDVGQWWVRIGDRPNTNDHFDSGRITDPNTRSVTVTGLPTDGRTIHLTLWYRTSSGRWFQQVTSYLTPTILRPLLPVEIVSPQPSTALRGPDHTFTWTSRLNDVGQWWVRIGDRPNTNDHFDSGRITDPNTRSVTVTGLPTDGRTIHLTLWYRTSSGRWFQQVFAYSTGS